MIYSKFHATPNGPVAQLVRALPWHGAQVNGLRSGLLWFHRFTAVSSGRHLDSRSVTVLLGLHMDSTLRSLGASVKGL